MNALHWINLLFGLLLFYIVRIVSGHAKMIDPPSRSTMWRFGFDTAINYDDNQLFCGGYRNTVMNDGKCGVCGDAYQGPYHNEAGGIYATGIIVRRYDVTDKYINISIDVTAHHKGYFQFRICPNNNVNERVKQSCLDKNVLQIKSREYQHDETRYYPKGKGIHHMCVVIPEGLTCSQCVLQWKYKTGNFWGVEKNGTSCMGCGIQELFVNCADISIGYGVNPKDSNRNPKPKLKSKTSPKEIQNIKNTVSSLSDIHRKNILKIVNEANARNMKMAENTTTGECNRCYALPMWTHYAGMDDWCERNCKNGNCPPCRCYCGCPNLQFENPCISKGEEAGFNLVNWCWRECCEFECPRDKCECSLNIRDSASGFYNIDTEYFDVGVGDIVNMKGPSELSAPTQSNDNMDVSIVNVYEKETNTNKIPKEKVLVKPVDRNMKTISPLSLPDLKNMQTGSDQAKNNEPIVNVVRDGRVEPSNMISGHESLPRSVDDMIKSILGSAYNEKHKINILKILNEPSSKHNEFKTDNVRGEQSNINVKKYYNIDPTTATPYNLKTIRRGKLQTVQSNKHSDKFKEHQQKEWEQQSAYDKSNNKGHQNIELQTSGDSFIEKTKTDNKNIEVYPTISGMVTAAKEDKPFIRNTEKQSSKIINNLLAGSFVLPTVTDSKSVQILFDVNSGNTKPTKGIQDLMNSFTNNNKQYRNEGTQKSILNTDFSEINRNKSSILPSSIPAIQAPKHVSSPMYNTEHMGDPKISRNKEAPDLNMPLPSYDGNSNLQRQINGKDITMGHREVAARGNAFVRHTKKSKLHFREEEDNPIFVPTTQTPVMFPVYDTSATPAFSAFNDHVTELKQNTETKSRVKLHFRESTGSDFLDMLAPNPLQENVPNQNNENIEFLGKHSGIYETSTQTPNKLVQSISSDNEISDRRNLEMITKAKQLPVRPLISILKKNNNHRKMKNNNIKAFVKRKMNNNKRIEVSPRKIFIRDDPLISDPFPAANSGHNVLNSWLLTPDKDSNVVKQFDKFSHINNINPSSKQFDFKNSMPGTQVTGTPIRLRFIDATEDETLFTESLTIRNNPSEGTTSRYTENQIHLTSNDIDYATKLDIDGHYKINPAGVYEQQLQETDRHENGMTSKISNTYSTTMETPSFGENIPHLLDIKVISPEPLSHEAATFVDLSTTKTSTERKTIETKVSTTTEATALEPTVSHKNFTSRNSYDGSEDGNTSEFPSDPPPGILSVSAFVPETTTQDNKQSTVLKHKRTTSVSLKSTEELLPTSTARVTTEPVSHSLPIVTPSSAVNKSLTQSYKHTPVTRITSSPSEAEEEIFRSERVKNDKSSSTLTPMTTAVAERSQMETTMAISSTVPSIPKSTIDVIEIAKVSEGKRNNFPTSRITEKNDIATKYVNTNISAIRSKATETKEELTEAVESVILPMIPTNLLLGLPKESDTSIDGMIPELNPEKDSMGKRSEPLTTSMGILPLLPPPPSPQPPMPPPEIIFKTETDQFGKVQQEANLVGTDSIQSLSNINTSQNGVSDNINARNKAARKINSDTYAYQQQETNSEIRHDAAPVQQNENKINTTSSPKFEFHRSSNTVKITNDENKQFAYWSSRPTSEVLDTTTSALEHMTVLHVSNLKTVPEKQPSHTVSTLEIEQYTYDELHQMGQRGTTPKYPRFDNNNEQNRLQTRDQKESRDNVNTIPTTQTVPLKPSAPLSDNGRNIIESETNRHHDVMLLKQMNQADQNTTQPVVFEHRDQNKKQSQTRNQGGRKMKPVQLPFVNEKMILEKELPAEGDGESGSISTVKPLKSIKQSTSSNAGSGIPRKNIFQQVNRIEAPHRNEFGRFTNLNSNDSNVPINIKDVTISEPHEFDYLVSRVKIPKTTHMPPQTPLKKTSPSQLPKRSSSNGQENILNSNKTDVANNEDHENESATPLDTNKKKEDVHGTAKPMASSTKSWEEVWKEATGEALTSDTFSAHSSTQSNVQVSSDTDRKNRSKHAPFKSKLRNIKGKRVPSPKIFKKARKIKPSGTPRTISVDRLKNSTLQIIRTIYIAPKVTKSDLKKGNATLQTQNGQPPRAMDIRVIDRILNAIKNWLGKIQVIVIE